MWDTMGTLSMCPFPAGRVIFSLHMLWLLAAVLVAVLPTTAAEWSAHDLQDLNLTSEAGPHSKIFFDPAWGPHGRVLLLPGTLEIVQPCSASVPGPFCWNCSVDFSPDARLLYFPVDPDLQPDDPILVTQSATSNVGPELLTPSATVYVPPRGRRPPLIVSYGGALVNQCTNTPYVLPYFTAECGLDMVNASLCPHSSWRSSSWCVTPSFSTHILRLDTLEWLHLSQNATGPDSLSPLATNTTGLFGLGVSLLYDATRDRLLMAGGFNMLRNDWESVPGRCDALQTMDLSLLCTDNESTRSSKDASRSTTEPHTFGYSLVDLNSWLEGPLRTDRLQWVQAASCILATTSSGMFAVDPVLDRVVQYGGADTLLFWNSLDCYVLDLKTMLWENEGGPAPQCSYGVVWYGPFRLWDAAYVVLPERRLVLLFGGSQQADAFGKINRFNVLDGHWALDLDTLVWEDLSSTELFWGLPYISGASAIAVPLPDNSTVIFLWGGFGAGNITNTRYSYQEVSCGLAARAQLAHPSLFGPGAVSSIYSVVLPPPIRRVTHTVVETSTAAVFALVPLVFAVAVTVTLMGMHLLLLRRLCSNDKVDQLSRVVPGEACTHPLHAVSAVPPNLTGSTHLARAAAVDTSPSEEAALRTRIPATSYRAAGFDKSVDRYYVELPARHERLQAMPRIVSEDDSNGHSVKLPIVSPDSDGAWNARSYISPIVRFPQSSTAGHVAATPGRRLVAARDTASIPDLDHGIIFADIALRCPESEVCEPMRVLSKMHGSQAPNIDTDHEGARSRLEAANAFSEQPGSTSDRQPTFGSSTVTSALVLSSSSEPRKGSVHAIDDAGDAMASPAGGADVSLVAIPNRLVMPRSHAPNRDTDHENNFSHLEATSAFCKQPGSTLDRQPIIASSAVISALALSSEPRKGSVHEIDDAGDTALSPVAISHWLIIVSTACAFIAHTCLASIISAWMLLSVNRSLTHFILPSCVASAGVAALAAAVLSLGHVTRLALIIPSSDAKSTHFVYRLLCCGATIPALLATMLSFFVYTEMLSRDGAQMNAMALLGAALCDIAVTLILSVDLMAGVIATRARDARREWRSLIQVRTRERRHRKASSRVQAPEWASEPLLLQPSVSELGADHVPVTPLS